MNKILAFVAVIVTLVSCKRDAGYTDSGAFNFLNASINAPKLDVFVDGSLYATKVAFPTLSNTFFIPVEGVPPIFRFAPSEGTQTIAYYGSISNGNLKNNTNYTIIATDSIDKVKLSFVNDTLVTPEVGYCRVRYFQLAADYKDTVNFLIDTFKIAQRRLFNDQASNTALHAFKVMKAGKYNLYLKKNDGTVIKSTTDIVLNPQKNYTIITKGSFSALPSSVQYFDFTLFEQN